jgi:hypothetical protein
MKRTAFSVALMLAMGGCSAVQDRTTAENAATEFHRRLDAGRFHEIYASASDDFRAAGTEAGMDRFLGTIHRRFGLFEDATPRAWRVNYTGGGTIVSLSYVAHFMRGDLAENFTFRVAGGSASLVGYHATSDALVAALRGSRTTAPGGGRPSVTVESGIDMPR